jgi:hypothetical protein
MNNQLPNTLDDILAHLYQPEMIDDAREQNHGPRTVNIYIDIEEQEDSQALPPTVEGTLDTTDNTTTPLLDEEQTEPPAPTPTTEPHKMVPPVKPQRHASMRPRLIVLIVALVAVLATLIGLNISVVLSPVFAPSASITIVTQSQQLTTRSILQLVTKGNADQRANQVPGRTLPAIIMSQQKTVATTGITHQDARAAHGLLTFYNGATYPQTIPAGTLLTGVDGVELVTDTDATIPVTRRVSDVWTSKCHGACSHGRKRGKRSSRRCVRHLLSAQCLSSQ